tara:strand:- start:650 stop:931 length:282 start_codon:yes stop_codon:yes gene_type:complete
MRDLDITLEDLGASIPDTSVERLRLQGTMLKRLPSIPGVSVDGFFMSSRAEEAAAVARAIGIAYEEDRRRAVIMRAKQRAEERLAMLYALGRL